MRCRSKTQKQIQRSPYTEAVRLRGIVHNLHLDIDLVERELEALADCLAPSRGSKRG